MERANRRLTKWAKADRSATRHDDVQDANRELCDPPTDPAEEFPDLSGLTEAEREVWVSVETEGLTPLELSRVSEWSSSTVRTLLSRARAKQGDGE